MKTSVIIDSTGKYRYSLVREWDQGLPRVLFVMLNPSTADAEKDDPTIRRCIGLAKNWGYGAIEVVNLFALRATSPKELRKVNVPEGIENDKYISEAVSRAKMVIAAWGVNGTYLSRNADVEVLIGYDCSTDLYTLELTKGGHPRHPLYVRGDVQPVLYQKGRS